MEKGRCDCRPSLVAPFGFDRMEQYDDSRNDDGYHSTHMGDQDQDQEQEREENIVVVVVVDVRTYSDG